MITTGKVIKDTEDQLSMVIKDMSLTISYTKTNKLITALYMVTDMIDKEEPLRNKLRTLGTGIISDINYSPGNARGKISEVMSFLDIASAINIISEMNCNILCKEFLELNHSIEESLGKIGMLKKQINLADFFVSGKLEENSPKRFSVIRGDIPIGHPNPTRIGVQKGDTLLKALSDKNFIRSVNRTEEDFVVLKQERRNDILFILKDNGSNATIKDIKDRVKNKAEETKSLVSCGEKTLQRELLSMVKDGVLYKTGEKRWSRYFIKN